MFFSSCSSLVSEFCFALSVCTSEHLIVKNFISIEGFEKIVAFCQNTLNHTHFIFFIIIIILLKVNIPKIHSRIYWAASCLGSS